MRTGRGWQVTILALVLFAAATPAYGFWTASTTGSYATATAATLPAPSLTTGSVTATSAALSWAPGFTPTGLDLEQSPASLTGCPGAPGVATSGCTASGLTPNTSYTWTLRGHVHAWVATSKASATTSRQSTTVTLVGTSALLGIVGASFTATATVTGDSGYGTPAGTATFSLYSTSACSGTAAYTSSPRTLSGGSASATFIPLVGTYYWHAAYSPTDSYNLPSASDCGPAVSVLPLLGSSSALETTATPDSAGPTASPTSSPSAEAGSTTTTTAPPEDSTATAAP